MPAITLSTFTDAVAANPTTVEENFYKPTNTGSGSLEVINGHLDALNGITGGWDFSREQIQQGALSRGKAIGGNTNLDYFGDTFLGWDIGTEGSDVDEADKFYRIIPGASMTFYLPYSPQLLVLSWAIFAAAKPDKYDPTATNGAELDDGEGGTNKPDGYFAPNYAAIIRAYHNGSRMGRKYFPVPPQGLSSSDGLGNWDRTWSSFYLIENPAAGWHNVSLRAVVPPITVHSGTNYERPNNQLRVRTRHMDYVYFR